MLSRIAFGSILIFSLALFACDDDEEEPTPDAAPEVDAAPEADAPDQAVTCETYCADVTANCGDYPQYADEAECLSYCGSVYAWDIGTAGETDTNTVACREYHAEAAADDAATHCPHAGPTGANMCGTWCDAYCGLIMNTCVDGNAQYADLAECTAACANFDDTGEIGAATGDTVQCRIYHAAAAYDDPATHCPHAGETPTENCVAQ